MGENIQEKSFKFLGHHIDENLKWEHHVKHVQNKLVSANFALSRSKALLASKFLNTIYRAFSSVLYILGQLSGA